MKLKVCYSDLCVRGWERGGGGSCCANDGEFPPSLEKRARRGGEGRCCSFDFGVLVEEVFVFGVVGDVTLEFLLFFLSQGSS